MTKFWRIRFRARRVAIWRISWMDQRMGDGFVSSGADGASSLAPYRFFGGGRRGRIGVNADRTHGEGEDVLRFSPVFRWSFRAEPMS